MRRAATLMAYGPILAVFLAFAGIFTPMAEAADVDAGGLLPAAASGDHQGYRRLLAAGTPSTRATGKAAAALLLAVDANHVEIAKALLDAGASVNTQPETSTRRGSSPAHADAPRSSR